MKHKLVASQLDIYLEQVKKPKSPIYNIGGKFVIRGELNISRLKAALALVITNNEALCTRLSVNDHEVYSYVVKDGSINIEFQDFSGKESQEKELKQALKNFKNRLFELHDAPLIRIALFKVSDNVHWFIPIAHHVIFDGWSFSMFLNDLFGYYDAANSEKLPIRPQYDVLRRNYEIYRNSEAYTESVRYWQESLAELPDVLLTRKSQQFAQDGQCSRITRPLTAIDFSKIEVMASELKISVMLFYTALLSVALGKAKGVNELIVGIPRHNRKGAEEKNVMGTSVIISPLLIKIDRELSFVDFIEQLNINNRAGYVHQRIPVGEIVRSIDMQKQGRDRLFDVTVNYQNLDFNLGNKTRDVEVYFLENDFDQCPLSLTICQYNSHQPVDIQLDYRHDYMNFEQADALFDRINHLLEQVLIDDSKVLKNYNLLMPYELKWLQAQNNTKKTFSHDACIQQLLERQVELTPNAVALHFNGKSLSYREFNNRVNQVARYLQKEGLAPNSIVGLMMERSIEMVIGLWGIIKAGCAYLPLDVVLPKQRLSLMAENAQCTHLLTNRHCAENVQLEGVLSIAMDDAVIKSIIDEQDCSNIVLSEFPERAYVIYTSGSTGTPKGVAVGHAALVNRIEWMQSEYPISSDDRVLQKTPFSFDVSVWEFTWPFTCGASLVIAKPEGHKDPSYLHQLIEQEKITTLHFVPSMLNVMLAGCDWGNLKSVRQVFCSGEALPGDVVEQFLSTGTQAQLHNLYGPTEAAIDVSHKSCHRGMTTVPIGKPIQNIYFWVLDVHMQILPPGEVGELHIGGVGLAEGYINSPELTADKFVMWKDPEGNSVRVYKTGDLVRWAENGELEYLGRTDHQVKLNGLRLELGEIEACLYQLPSINECVVTVYKENGQNRFLLAYIAQHDNGKQLNESQIVNELSRHLPDHMVPKHYQFIKSLPLSSNGKIDRNKLPEYKCENSNSYQAPSNEIEVSLCQLWQTVLKVKKVGIDDNFYALGGDSIMAISLAAKAKKLDINLQVQDFLTASNIRALALLAQGNLEGGDNDNISIEPFELVSEEVKSNLASHSSDAFPLSALQAGMVFHTHLNEDSAVYHDIFSCEIVIDWQEDKFSVALDEMVKRHEALRSYIDINGDIPLQIVAAADDSTADYNFLDLSHMPEELQVNYLAEWQSNLTASRFDWEGNNRLYQIYIHDRGEKNNKRLLQYTLSFHHALLDGWSVASFTTQLFKNYLALMDNQPLDISLPSSYREFIALEQRALCSKDTRMFWLKKLADTPINQLPRLLDEKKSKETGTAQSVLHKPLTFELAKAINDTAKQLGVHEKQLMLAAHFKVLSLMFGQDKVTTCLVSNGRPNNVNAQFGLGLFLNSLPLSIDLSAHNSWSDLIIATEALYLESYPHRRFPYSEIQRLVDLDFSEVLFNYVNFHIYDELNANEAFELKSYNFYEETNFNLLVQVIRDSSKKSVELELIYNGQLFSENLMSRYAEYLQLTLKSMVVAPELAQVKDEIVIDNDEIRLLTHEWNDTQYDYDKTMCIGTLLEQQALNNSSNIALVFENESLSYGRLNEKANQLAHWLISQGVKPDTPVAIGFERSFEMVIAIWAVLKAGGAYVPLEPGYPHERLKNISEDAQFKVLLTSSEHLGNFEFDNVHCIACDSEAFETQLEQQSSENPKLETLDARHLAYIIFTSGSTGKPKGVMVEHQALYNRIHWMQRKYPLCTQDRVLQKTPYTFDVSVWEFIWPALSGATLVLAKPQGHKDPDYLAEIIEQQQITTLHFVPSMLQLMQAQIQIGKLTSIQKVFSSGEALSVELHKRFIQSVTKYGSTAQLYNLYGPTEAAIDVSYYNCNEDFNRNSIPIGKPISNVRLFIVDQQDRICPVGVPGELLITGDGLARGYINREELTAERFVQWQLPNGESLRAYRTGDLAYWSEVGDIEYLGRTDHQVKIRGLRIELAEIETLLLAHGKVKEVTVLPCKNRSGEDILVAFLVPDKSIVDDSLTSDLTTLLASKLPEYMLPNIYHYLDSMPLGHSGKVDRKLLLGIDLFSKKQVSAEPESALVLKIIELWKKVLNVEYLAGTQSWKSLGATSLDAVKLAKHMSEMFECKIKVVDLFKHTTANQWAQHLKEENSNYDQIEPLNKSNRSEQDSAIAIIGMSGLFAGAEDLSEYFEALLVGEMLVRDLSDEELRDAGVPLSHRQEHNYVRRRAPLKNPLHFDNQFFGYTAREAELMDPQLRLMHQQVFHVLEDGGYAVDKTNSSIGLFGGAANNQLWKSYVQPEGYSRISDWFEVNSLTDREFYMTRIAHSLGLNGPAVNIQSACSTSLVAVHSAINSLRNGDCDMAVVCTAALSPVKMGYHFQEGMIASPDGICRPFDSGANGTVPGEGVASILLKPLSQAIKDRDHIRSVIYGSAINNDGRAKVGYTAPSVQGQARVIAAALQDAAMKPDQIAYVESHGTGTVMGDPIESEALNLVFGKTEQKRFLGAVKANIGHLDASAGLAGLIKATLSMERGVLPPVINYHQTNSECELEKSGFNINTTAVEWNDMKRFAGISSFGIGGTNAHVIIGEKPPIKECVHHRPEQLVTLSGNSVNALAKLANKLADALDKSDAHLADFVYSLNIGRSDKSHRVGFVCSQKSVLLDQLRSMAKIPHVQPVRQLTSLVFMFTGQGSQYLGMYQELYRHEHIFTTQVDRCLAILADLGQSGLSAYLDSHSEGLTSIDNTDTTQSLLFVCQYALAQQLLAWGIKPTAIIGHSIGELIGACIAGVMSLEDALMMVYHRGRLMRQAEPGSMMAVHLPSDTLTEWLSEDVVIAAKNSPELCVVAGKSEAIEVLSKRLDTAGIKIRLLHTSHAYHSPMMLSAATEFASLIADISFAEPSLPIISNLTGDWVKAGQMTTTQYWVKHILQQVNFADGIGQILQQDNVTFLELGPGRTLSTFVRNHHHRKDAQVLETTPSAKEHRSARLSLLQSVAKLYQDGVIINWENFYSNEPCQRLSLPTYPFDEQVFNRMLPEHDQQLPGSPIDKLAVLDEGSTLNDIENGIDSSRRVPFVEASNSTERLLVEIWQQLFLSNDIGIYDNFFDLGGHSLMSTTMLSKINQLFGTNLKLHTVMNSPTIVELGNIIDMEIGNAAFTTDDDMERGML